MQQIHHRFSHNYLTCYTVSLCHQTHCFYVRSCMGILHFDQSIFCKCQHYCILIDSGIALKSNFYFSCFRANETDNLAFMKIRSVWQLCQDLCVFLQFYRMSEQNEDSKIVKGLILQWLLLPFTIYCITMILEVYSTKINMEPFFLQIKRILW